MANSETTVNPIDRIVEECKSCKLYHEHDCKGCLIEDKGSDCYASKDEPCTSYVNNAIASFQTMVAGWHNCVHIQNGVTYLVAHIENLYKEYWKKHNYRMVIPKVEYRQGSKYYKIYAKEESGSRRVWGFVNSENGAVHRARSWAAPEVKYSLGNVLDSNTWTKFEWVSPGYKS